MNLIKLLTLSVKVAISGDKYPISAPGLEWAFYLGPLGWIISGKYKVQLSNNQLLSYFSSRKCCVVALVVRLVILACCCCCE